MKRHSLCSEAQEAAAGRAHALQHELQEARAAGEERSREVAQLREVSVQADQALQQCMAQLQVQTRRLPPESIRTPQLLTLFTAVCIKFHTHNISGV